MARFRCWSLPREDGFEHRQLQIQPRGAITQRAQILGQAGSAERESGFQIRGGDVQFVIAAQRSITSSGGDAQTLPRSAPISLAKPIFTA